MGEMKRLNEKFGVYKKKSARTGMVNVRVNLELLEKFNLVQQQAKEYGFNISKSKVVRESLENLVAEWEDWYDQH